MRSASTSYHDPGNERQLRSRMQNVDLKCSACKEGTYPVLSAPVHLDFINGLSQRFLAMLRPRLLVGN